MGWVYLFLLLHTCTCSPQLWEWGRVEGEARGARAEARGASVEARGARPEARGAKTEIRGNVKGTEEGEEWKPNRAPKSLAFLGSKEIEQVEDNTVDSGPDKLKAKKAKLNVSDKDSPYALIDKYFPERESYFYQNQDKFVDEYRGQESKTDIGNIHPSEVWLAEDSLLVLKGGSTIDRSGWDDPWQPLDNFQAPYREPVLPPPDFDPDSLEIGVGVDIEILLAERAAAKEQRLRELRQRDIDRLREQFRAQNKIPDVPEMIHNIPDIPAFVDPDNELKPYRDDVIQTHQKEFKTFFNDVSKFISDMENFHSARKASPRQEVDEPVFRDISPSPVQEAVPSPPPKARKAAFKPVAVPPSPPPPAPAARDQQAKKQPFTSFPRSIQPTTGTQQENTPSPAILQEVHHSSSIEVLPKSFREPPSTPTTSGPQPEKETMPAWQREARLDKGSEVEARDKPTTPYPLSYSSPHSKVFLSTKYVTHPPSVKAAPSSTTQLPQSPTPVRLNQARTPKRITSNPSQDQNRSFTFTPSPPPPPPAPVRIFRPRSTTPLPATPPPTTPSSRPARRQGTTSAYRTPFRESGVQEDWRPVTLSPTPLRSYPGTFNPAPTPYSLFQSVPENIAETDVFHLSQNVDFGKKIESQRNRAPLTNEVDTGFRRHSSVPFSPSKHVSTRSPRLVSPKARQPKHHGHGGGGFRPSLKAPPAKQKASGHSGGRVRSSLRRRRPKAVRQTPAGDRTGTGDVRYVSFYSGGPGGNAWGYSYNLG